MSTKYVCRECGGDSIEVMIWIDPNDPRTAYSRILHSSDTELPIIDCDYDVCNCEDCNTTTSIKSVDEE